MPVNATYEYVEAEKKFQKAVTIKEKLDTLKEMLSKAPSHKGAETLRKEIKEKIAKLKDKAEKQMAKRSGYSISVKKEGAASVVLVGLTNSGKSYVLSKLTNAKPEISQYEYTTKMPEVGVMDYEGIKLQIIELPSISKGYSEAGKGPSFMAIARTADLIVIVLDGNKELNEQLFIIEDEFKKSFVELDKDIPVLILVNKEFKRFLCSYKVTSLEELKENIWKKLDLIYVYTKLPGKEKDYPPIALKKGSNVRDIAVYVHKDFIRRFRFARIWGKSVKHDASQAGLLHKLEEGDVVEFHLK